MSVVFVEIWKGGGGGGLALFEFDSKTLFLSYNLHLQHIQKTEENAMGI
jgi:hypothetical protein